MADLTVSVVVPVRNGERFLGEALESVRAQTVAPLEVIVVDDGSTDATAAVAERFGVRLIRRAAEGVSATRNAGIAAARGDVVAFLDHDDLWEPVKLERQVGDLAANPDAAYGLCRMTFLVDPGTARPSWITDELADGAGFVGYCAGSLVARRSTFDAVGGFDPGLALGEDADWFLRAQDAGLPRVVTDEVLVRYRVHGSNSTLTGNGVGAPAVLRVLRMAIERRRAGAPLVSVCLAVRDGEAFLAEAIESVLEQSHRALELIVVDDGSTDSSGEIASGYGDRVRCVTLPPSGLGAARNAGVAEARGRYVAFIDADDRWPPDRLASQLRAFDLDPAPELVFGHARRFAAAAGEPEPARVAGTLLVPRAVLERVGPFDTHVSVGEFMGWLLRARDLGLRELMLSDVVLERRVHETNLTKRARDSYGDYARILGAALARRRAAES